MPCRKIWIAGRGSRLCGSVIERGRAEPREGCSGLGDCGEGHRVGGRLLDPIRDGWSGEKSRLGTVLWDRGIDSYRGIDLYCFDTVGQQHPALRCPILLA
jgi:hypothetical protein